jgi:predicted membrane channel-forming protein YqfA (hemolysin III family)
MKSFSKILEALKRLLELAMTAWLIIPGTNTLAMFFLPKWLAWPLIAIVWVQTILKVYTWWFRRRQMRRFDRFSASELRILTGEHAQ